MNNKPDSFTSIERELLQREHELFTQEIKRVTAELGTVQVKLADLTIKRKELEKMARDLNKRLEKNNQKLVALREAEAELLKLKRAERTAAIREGIQDVMKGLTE
jgi:chromosome segregation ATPase